MLTVRPGNTHETGDGLRLPADAERALSRLTFPATGKIAIAVSGGGDSMALLAMLAARHDLLDTNRLLAITIDHGLRVESADEAAEVARWCAGRGIAHATRRWADPVTGPGVQAAARLARYRLLSQAALDAGAIAVLTAHTRDDQRETVAMRQLRGEGRGLSGIAPATLFMESGLWFCRPFLGVARDSLRQWLAGAGISWVDDPSNDNARFERVRLRRALNGVRLEDAADLDVAASTFAAERVAMARQVADWLDRHVTSTDARAFMIDRAAFGTMPEVELLALRILLAHAGRRDHLPGEGQVAGRLGPLAALAPLRFTLGGAVVSARRGSVSIKPEGPRRGVDRPSGERQQDGLHPWASLLPIHDIEAVRALSRLAGLAEPESPPVGGI
ncbi:MAG: tRNA lysidine(34) synthetase TilS [Notoacmeibacter sp.]|nr:tRNA lysidine(34) synthetase TilS [Notoacmeibacter sp.]